MERIPKKRIVCYNKTGRMKQKNKFLILLILATAGLAIALFLAHHHYTLMLGKAFSFPLCQKGCDAVNASSYSELFGIPVASYGAVAYFGVALLSLVGVLLGGLSSGLLLSLVFLTSLLCVTASLVLAWISLFKLSSFCNLCGLTYLINLLLLAVSARGFVPPLGGPFKTVAWACLEALKKQDPRRDATESHQKSVALLILLILLLSSGSGLAVSFFHSERYRVADREKMQQFLEHYGSLPRVALETQSAPVKGSPNPKLTLVVFSDFTCSHCRNAAFLLDRLLPEYRKDLKLVYKHQVHDRACNPYKEHLSPQQSCQLAKAAICAQKQGKFWEYHDLLFENPEAGKLVSFAQEVGLEREAFETCLKNPETDAALLKDLEEAHRLGVSSTPTLFLNGRKVQGLPPAPLLHALLRRELRDSSR